MNAPESIIAVVIPCYRVRKHVLAVIDAIGSEVSRIYCVDDACPERSGDVIEQECRDPRVQVLRHVANQGVGGAMLTGYQRAAADGATVVVKLDGDGQMDPALLYRFVLPIQNGEADYCKGNRFWDLGEIKQMPLLRRIGNLGLSFMAKASTGYWDVFDPTNGYTAIHARIIERLPVKSISKRYFFETDMLFRLNTMRAVVVDVPMDAKYADEESNLKISKVIGEFSLKHSRNLIKRVLYRYYLRDLSIASLELVAALVLLTGGVVYGGIHWWLAFRAGVPASTGNVVLPALAIMSGLQFLLAFLGYDIQSVPRRPIHRSLAAPVK
ncbi:glycosyltransferase family 2 protein [Stenotrophomonas sp. ATCM1_4]|uniref:glycosyltransferase family 2 protein n=1 Tax=Stenotrophomonas sp. ATCM1_4 TaxID=2259330 RepID=UPI0010436C52|nr:glycosyltransferase family 2 protein [Stenotrophomonas sp. ATCM1_4]TDB29241.1 glycosyltransferase family 2 protein [Stenotrophomonas sp. ATCM1_4]